MSHNKFRCEDEECIKAYKEEDEDNRLVLQVIEGEIHQYYIADDGMLTHYDSEGTGQETFLECKLCGAKYDFDSNCFELKWQHSSPIRNDGVIEMEFVKRK